MALDYIALGGVVLGIVDLVGRVVGWVIWAIRRRKKETEDELEDRILEYMANEWEWRSPHAVWAEVCLGPLVEDIPFDVAFPPPLSGWPKARWKLKNLWIEIRHRWRKRSRLPPKGAVKKIMLQLWKRDKLQRMPGTKFYRLKL